MGALLLPSERSTRSRTSPGRVSERQPVPQLGLGRRHSRRTQRTYGTAMRLCASLFRRRRGPAGLRNLFLLLSELWLVHPALRTLCVYEVGVVSLPSACFACCRNAGRPLVKMVYLPFSRSDRLFIDSNGETVESPTSYSSTGRTMREQYRCVLISRPE